MLRIFKTVEGRLSVLDKIEEDSWICLTDPSLEEVMEVAEVCKIDADDLRASLDEEEASRIEITDDYTLILVDVPSKETRNGNQAYTTIPLAIILMDKMILTVCLEDTIVLRPFINEKVRDFHTFKKTRFVYQILYSNTSAYLHYLRRIDKKREEMEAGISQGTTKNDLIVLHELESDLVYFATSLRVNGVVLDKLSRYSRIKQYPEDKELLSDVIIENQQAIEMANIYRDILNGTRELFSSMIDNSLNNVMKVLTSVTIIMAIPNIISGMWGMNVEKSLPFVHTTYGFYALLGMIVVSCCMAAIILKKKDLF
ncbi:MAG: magnesium transporter CorA family protein [Lachnospiraceae bacterium]|nr:magnesium transporter CorA family protein [Lachnospiraceae bacterium]